MINLIDQEGIFNQKLTEFPSATANIAIFGSQSSGKSTLMNYAFGTNFNTLDTRKTRQQCTKGVWLQNIQKFNIIDTEGFDSIERARQSRIYERQIALFSLALADVIMINVWMKEIGRYDGGQIGILKTILKAASFLVKSQNKTLMFVIKDCTSDADKSILKEQLEITVRSIIKTCEKQHKSTLKFNIEYYFMSHYVYNNEQYQKQAKLLPSQIRIRKSNLQQYDPKDRLVFLSHIWETIRANQGDLDLRMEQEALRSFIVARVRKQVRQEITKQIQVVNRIGQTMSYQRFYEHYIKKSFQLIKKRIPRFLNEKTVKKQFFLLEQQLQYAIHKRFDEVILPNEEKFILIQTLDKQLRKSYKSIQLEKIISQQRKAALQSYKFLVKGHKQSTILIKTFAEKITQSSVMYETQVSHLFNMFENNLQLLINKQLDNQVKKLKFDGSKISQKVRDLCKKFQYNEWQLNLTQIWQRASHRVLTQKLFEKIQNTCSGVNYTMWVGDKQSEIITRHKTLQRECEQFIDNLLQFFNQDEGGTQYFQKAKQKIRNCLEKALLREKKRFRMTMLILALFLLFFYTEFIYLLKIGKFKKRSRRYMANAYLLLVTAMIAISIIRRRFAMASTSSQ